MKLSKKQKLLIRLYKTKFNTISIFSKKKAAESLFKLFCTPYSGKVKRKAPPFFKRANEINFNYEGNIIRGWQWIPNNCNGKKVLVAHGFDSCCFKSESIIHKLYLTGFEVLAFDALAHGESDGKTVNVIQYTACMNLINEKFGKLYAIVGHSFGALAACLVVEKTLKEVERIVLIAPAVETTRAIDNFFKFLKMPIALKPYLENYITEESGNTPEFYSVTRALNQITAKVLWVHDEKDFICPIEDVKSTKEKNLPNVEFYFTKGLGHNAIYRNPNVLQKVAFFLYE
jgi:pimeloyl-ACP methyl ester carboxylesterase